MNKLNTRMFDLFTKYNMILTAAFIAISCFLVWLCRRAQRSPYSDLGRFGGILLGHLTDHSKIADIGPPVISKAVEMSVEKVKRKRHRFTKQQRHYLARRQNYKCKQCGIHLGHDLIDCDIDHIIPLSQGGADWGNTDGERNLQFLCTYCHRIKTKQERSN